LERHQFGSLQFAHVLASRTERIEKLEAANRRLTGSRKAIVNGEAAGPAIGALAMIMSDPAISIRKRVQAAEGLLAYKTPQDVAEAAKVFLASIFTDPEQNIDDRLAATTALRKSEDTRIMPPIERPPARTATVEEPAESLRDWWRGAGRGRTECSEKLSRLGTAIRKPASGGLTAAAATAAMVVTTPHRDKRISGDG